MCIRDRTKTDPGFKGNTATNTLKPATLETGAEKMCIRDRSNTAPFKNAGSYELTINSSQFAKDEDFAATFWGHQAKLGAKITPADSRVTDFTYSTTGTNKTETLTLTANVKPQAGEAKTCEAPDGYVQFYICLLYTSRCV